MQVKFLDAEIKKTTGEYDGQFVLSSETRDRDGDVILADGWDLENFLKNPIALFGHSHTLKDVVGTWHNVHVAGNRLIADFKAAATNVGQTAKQLIKEGVLRAVSVGFRPKKVEPLSQDDPAGGFLIREAELYEASLVAVPANPDAIRVVKSFQLTDEEKSLIFASETDAPCETADTAILDKVDELLGKSARSMTRQDISIEEDKSMTLSEKIEAKRKKLEALRDALADAASTYAENATDEAEEAVSALTKDVEDEDKQLTTLESAEKSIMSALADRQETEPDEPRAPAIIKSTKNYEPGELIFRQAAVKLLAFTQSNSIDHVVKSYYPNDRGLEALTKATDAVPATIGGTGWADSLLGEQVAGFVDLLANNSVYGALRSRGLSLNFESGSSSIKIPARSATPNLAGSFVGEGAPIRVGQLAMTSQTLEPNKLAVISTMTEEVMDATGGQLEAIVRQAIIDDTTKALDTVLLDANAATADRPIGLLNGVTPTVSAGDTVANIITDLKALLGAFNVDDASKNLVIPINPIRVLGLQTAINAVGELQFAAELARGTILGIPIAPSANVATDEVHAINAGEFVTAGAAPSFSVSNTATLHMEQDAPDVAEIVSTTPTTADPVRSLFQTNTVGIKMIWPVTWVMRRAAQVSSLSSVSW